MGFELKVELGCGQAGCGQDTKRWEPGMGLTAPIQMIKIRADLREKRVLQTKSGLSVVV